MSKMEEMFASGNAIAKKSDRDPGKKATDAAALRAIAQAAIEVELFTIPLYMGSLYSIYGMHPITGQNLDFYKGRLWPGAHPVRDPETNEEKAFNILFSVFIDEMLHLQLASNMATAVSDPNAPPQFSKCSLVDPDTHAWKCYGQDKTSIPNIVDLAHTRSYQGRTERGLAASVNLGELNEEALWLFCAIERDDAAAQEDILPQYEDRYFPVAPFDDIRKPDGTRGPWQIGDALPAFGSIGWMYQCYSNYVNLTYSDKTTLWDEVFNPNGQQNDLFNNFGGPGHPMREFMGFETTIALTYKDIAKAQMLNMMSAITDQGEGSVLKARWERKVGAALAALGGELDAAFESHDYDKLCTMLGEALGTGQLNHELMPAVVELAALRPQGLQDARQHSENRKRELFERVSGIDLRKVKKAYRPSPEALESDYPSFNDKGELQPSADAAARTEHDRRDHFERFNTDIRKLLKRNVLNNGVKTWGDWWKERKAAGRGWEAADLHVNGYEPPLNDPIPSCEAVADALNTLAQSPGDYQKTLTQASVGAIAGVLTVLDDFWSAGAQASKRVLFPFPSMVGSGDRMAICWAVFGAAPDLSTGLEPLEPKTLYHACQGLDLNIKDGEPNSCAQVGVFHSCRGSNQCNAQGGCGFVQLASGGGNCGSSTALQMRTFANGCNPIPIYSAPGDNRCHSFGGCAVPISASQRFPRKGKMALFDYKLIGGMQPYWEAVPLNMTIEFDKGDRVDKIAYMAYSQVMAAKKMAVPSEPDPTPLRIAMPPST
ncbi:ferritin-like domain-containing protein [Burkholderia sp. F1]|uniref:ferritin-like domain-containing protein n=1 Tax=Burkholderia sp. F1 TaxID=3366817 RepID=UPI003D75D753